MADLTTSHFLRFRRLMLFPACLVGAALNIWLACCVFLQGAWQGRNDFLGLYAGARLVGGLNLYDRDAGRSVQMEAVGETFEIPYVRPPCYALFLRPLGFLGYKAAYTTWVVLSAGAFLGFLALWPGPAVRARWLVGCWSLPAFVSLFNGQDTLVLLLWTALAMRLLRSGREVAAGMVLALCASKFHLACLIPLVILAQRRWRMAGGMAIGGCILLALSFAVAGGNWPQRYLAVLTDSRINPSVDHMPNLHSLLGTGRFGLPFEAVAGLLVAAGLFLAAAKAADFERPFALSVAAGLLVGFHGYLADGVLLLPALMTFCTAGDVRFPAIALSTPVPWIVLQLPRPWPALNQLLIVALVITGFLRIARSERLD